MLAGAHGIDLVLLVVAADDGVMPQTEEHLDIVHLLGARRGVVAITKVDLVDAARRRGGARGDRDPARRHRPGGRADRRGVDRSRGEGIEALREAIGARAARACHPPRAGRLLSAAGRPRLRHARARRRRHRHRHRGRGATGRRGARAARRRRGARALRAGARRSGRERPLRAARGAQPRRRRARRGAARTGDLRPGARSDHRPLRRLGRAAPRRAAGRCAAMPRCASTSAPPRRSARSSGWTAATRWRRRRPPYAQLVLREPIAAFGGDRFILRAETARATIGGGVVLHPFATPPAPRASIRACRGSAALRRAATPLRPSRRPAGAGARTSRCRPTLSPPPPTCAPTRCASLLAAPPRPAAPARRDARRGVHDAGEVGAPARRGGADARRLPPRPAAPAPGMEMESLRSQLAADLPPKLFRAVVEQLAAEKVLVREDSAGAPARPPRPACSGAEAQLARAHRRALLAAGGFTPPDVKQLDAELGVAAAAADRDRSPQLERDGAGRARRPRPLLRPRRRRARPRRDPRATSPRTARSPPPPSAT